MAFTQHAQLESVSSTQNGHQLTNNVTLTSQPCDRQKMDVGQDRQGSQKLQDAYNYLGKCIGYQDHHVDLRRLNIIFADTLTTLERLKTGHFVSHQPHQMPIPVLLREIAKLVPKDCVDLKRVARIKQLEGPMAARAAKLVALGDHVKGLLDPKPVAALENGVEIPTTNDTGRSDRQAIIESQARVEKALDQIEQWCDSWLKGDLKGEDWYSLGDC